MRLPALAVFCGLLFGQDTPPAPPRPPAPPVLEYSGKPLLLPFQCTDEDVQLAGLACSEDDPCPIYLELSAVAAMGQRVLVGGNLHSASVTMFSTLLASEDGGKTWREPHDRIRAAAIDRLQFLDADTGWAAGEKLQPLPQDPFLLLTTDGGKSWRQHPIFSESAENRFGTIQQFSFAGKDSGSLIVDRGTGADGDRYELYESPDSGSTWQFKQSSNKPLTLRRPPAVSTEWRLRVDSRTQAYRIERRSGERWTDIAAFAVKVGACKP
jgi:photosystem II stability/assembly factor-like uncharacterized protein